VQWVVPGERNGGEKKAYFVSTGNQHSPGYGATDGFFRSRKKGQQRIIYKPMRKVDSVVADVVNRGTGENGTDTNGTSAPGSNRVDVVRIDLRGNTLSVLAGANTTLHQAQLLILTIGQNWAHAPSLFEVMVMTRAVGYSLVEIPTEASATLHEEAPALAGTVLTLLFVRDRSPLWGLLQLPDHRIAHGLAMTPVGPSMDPGLRAIYIQSLKDLLWSVENDVVFKEKVEKKKRAKEFRKQKLINQLIADSVKKNYDALSGKLQREMDEANVKMAPDYAAINAGRMPTPNQYPILNDSP
jgi:hypothetical protein